MTFEEPSVALFEHFNKKAEKYATKLWNQEEKRLKEFEKLVHDMSYDDMKIAKEIFDKEFTHWEWLEGRYNNI